MSSLDQFPHAPALPASREAFVEQQFHAGRDLRSGDTGAKRVAAAEMVGFWRQAGPFDVVRQGRGFRPPLSRNVSLVA